MRNETSKVLAVIFGALLLWLLWHKVKPLEMAAKPIQIEGVPEVKYVVPDIIISDPTLPYVSKFDWMNGEQCGCDGIPQNAVIVDTFRLIPRTEPGYSYMIDNLTMPPPAVYDPAGYNSVPLPPPIIYTAPTPTFWWAWEWGGGTFTRVIKTSDNFTIYGPARGTMAEMNATGPVGIGAPGIGSPTHDIPGTWEIVGNSSIFDKITKIRYNAQIYVLDESKSK